MGRLRQHKILQADADRVTKAALQHGDKGLWTSTANDLPGILWAQAQSFRAEPSTKGKAAKLFVLEDGTYKEVVTESQKTEYMRRAILQEDSEVPLSRDSGIRLLQQRTVGISRRAWAAFLKEQEVLQRTRAVPNQRRKGGMKLTGRGHLEMDLIEGKRKDVFDTFMLDDWYWLSIVDRLTSYTIVIYMGETKRAKVTSEHLAAGLKEMTKALRAPVLSISSDRGSEFHAETKKLLKDKGIKQIFVNRGNKIEKQNRTFQHNFYRLYKMRRGRSFTHLSDQAQTLTNNTYSKHLKMSPTEAVLRPDSELVPRFNSTRDEPESKYRAVPINAGDRVRHLLKHRKHLYGLDFKSYRGKHWSIKPVAVQLKKKVGNAWRYLVRGTWRDRDELQLANKTDAVTAATIADRRARQDKKHAGWRK